MTLKRAALWCIAGTAAILAVAALAAALAARRPHLVRPWLERALAPRGGTASIADLKVSLSPPVLELSGLTIEDPAGDGEFTRLDRLRIEPAPSRLLLGGPWLRRVEADGLVFDRRRPRETEGPIDLSPITRLFDIEHLSLADARLRIAFPDGVLSADGIRISLIPGKGGRRAFKGSGEIAYRRKEAVLFTGAVSAGGTVTPEPAIEADVELSPARVELPQLAGDLSMRTMLQVSRKHIGAVDTAITLAKGRVRTGPTSTESLEPVLLRGSARASLDGKDLLFDVARLDVGGLLLARGRFVGSSLDTIAGSLEGEIPRAERVTTLFSPFLHGGAGELALAGRLPCRLRLSGKGKARELALDFFPKDARFSWPKGDFACRFGGTFVVAVPLAGWNPGGVSLGWNLSAPAGDATCGGHPLPLGALEIRGSAGTAGDSFRIEKLTLLSSSLGRLSAELVYRGGEIAGRVEGANLPADNLVSLARAISGRDWKGWTASGAVGISARVDPMEGATRVAATATILDVGASSPSGDLMCRNLSGGATIEARLSPRPVMKADLSLRSGEALWGTVYLDLSKNPLDLHAEGTRTGPDAYEDLSLSAGLEGYGRAAARGKMLRADGTWRHQGEIALRDARLGPIFGTFLRDPLATTHGDLSGLEMDGTAEGTLSFSGAGEAAVLEGTLRLRSGELRRGSGPPILTGFDLDLPLAYSLGTANPGRSRPPDASRWGRLKWKELRLAGWDLGPSEFPAVLVPNRFYLDGTIETPLFGGKLSLRRIQVEDPLSSGFRIRMAAQLDNLDLARAAGDNSVLEGRLGGLLDPVSIGRDRMTADGKLAGDLFGGRLEIGGISVERPFAAGRETGADVTVRLIDLERLSAALGVGRISGRLSGSIEGLRFAYGQPVAFHLRMESVETKGVGQSVSLKAVNSISLVSTGSSLSGLGVSMMTALFKEFDYSRIGFECSLRNDVFTVRGLIREDGVEYLVKRRFFSGIDVINGNPDNRIGFSDMVERARRVAAERPR